MSLLQELPLGANTAAGTVPGAVDTSGNTYYINNNKLTAQNAGDPWANNKFLLVDNGSECTNQRVEITWTGDAHIYAVLRYQSPGNCYLVGAGGPLFIVKCVGGVFTPLEPGGISRNTSLPEKIIATVEGTLLTCEYYDSTGTLITTITKNDSTFTGESKFGLVYSGNTGGTRISQVKSYDLEGAIELEGKVVFDGNSLTLGTGWGATEGNTYPEQCIALLGETWVGQNLGVGAQTTQMMIDDAVSQVDIQFNPSIPRNICVAWEGRNHIQSGATGQQAIDAMIEYLAARRAVGFETILLSITASRLGNEPPEFNANATQFNDYFAANWSDHCDRFVAVHNDPHIGFNVDPEGSEYFSDWIHLNDLGYSIPATGVANAILAEDVEPPAVPTGLAGIGKNEKVLLTWDANSDDVASYRLDLNGTTYNAGNVTTYLHTALDNGNPYTYRVRSADEAGNLSSWSSPITVIPALFTPAERLALIEELWAYDGAGGRTLTGFDGFGTLGEDVTAIKAKTDNLPSSPASTSDVQPEINFTPEIEVQGGFSEENAALLTAIATLIQSRLGENVIEPGPVIVLPAPSNPDLVGCYLQLSKGFLSIPNYEVKATLDAEGPVFLSGILEIARVKSAKSNSDSMVVLELPRASTLAAKGYKNTITISGDSIKPFQIRVSDAGGNIEEMVV